MSTAPKDGTPIEILNTYGIRPTWGLFVWFAGRWNCFHDANSSLMDDQVPWLKWRAYHGDPDSYVDPTNGLQNEPEYWR